MCGSVKVSFTSEVGFARVKMVEGISTANYHNKTTESYVIISGAGILRVKNQKGEISEVELKSGVVVKIEPKEIHQTNNTGSLVLEAITNPAWEAEDELVAEESLFSSITKGSHVQPRTLQRRCLLL